VECLAGYERARQVANGPLARAAKSKAQIASIVELMRATAANRKGKTVKRSKRKVSETEGIVSVGQPQCEQLHEEDKLGGIAARSAAFTRGLAKHPYFAAAAKLTASRALAALQDSDAESSASEDDEVSESSKENGCVQQLFFHSTDCDRVNRAEATPRPADTLKPAAADSDTSDKHLPLKKRRALLSTPFTAKSLLPFDEADGEKRMKASPPQPKAVSNDDTAQDSIGTANTLCSVGYRFIRPLKGDDGADLGWHEAQVVQELDGDLRLVLYPSVGFVETLSLRDLGEIQCLAQNQ